MSLEPDDQEQPDPRDQALADAITATLLEANPMNIGNEDSPDQYGPEAWMILPQLARAQSVHDVADILLEVFWNAFGSLSEQAQVQARCVQAAEPVWRLWAEWNGKPAPEPAAGGPRVRFIPPPSGSDTIALNLDDAEALRRWLSEHAGNARPKKNLH